VVHVQRTEMIGRNRSLAQSARTMQIRLSTVSSSASDAYWPALCAEIGLRTFLVPANYPAR